MSDQHEEEANQPESSADQGAGEQASVTSEVAAEIAEQPELALAPAELDADEQAAWVEYQQKIAAARARKAALEAARLAAAAGVQSEIAVADSWYVDTTDAPPVLLLEREGDAVATLTLDQEVLQPLLVQLNELYILPDEAPLNYQVRIPDVANAQPIFSITRGGRVLASMTLDEEFNANVGSILRSMYPVKPQEPWLPRAKAWVRRHKVYTGLLVLLALPVVVILAQGIYHSIVGSFS